MNIAFFGSSKYSTIIEEALYEKFGLSLVLTLPDRILTRKKILTPNPVKIFAQKIEISVVTSDKIDPQIINEVKKIKPDFLVVADYGLFLPNELLELPKYASLNVHHSLLPKYRGPSPAPTAILNGDKISGVSVIKMSKKLDAGDIVAQKEYELKPDETTESLLTRLNELGGNLITEVIENYEEFSKLAKKQDEEKATYTKKMGKEDGYIELSNLPGKEKLDQMIRAYYPWPTVWGKWQMANGKWQILKLLPQKKLQVEGGKPMSAKDFLNGYPEAKEWIDKII